MPAIVDASILSSDEVRSRRIRLNKTAYKLPAGKNEKSYRPKLV